MNRTTIKVPGFTAEASLFTTGNNYYSEGIYAYPASAKMIVPQRKSPVDCVEECERRGYGTLYCHALCSLVTK